MILFSLKRRVIVHSDTSDLTKYQLLLIMKQSGMKCVMPILFLLVPTMLAGPPGGAAPMKGGIGSDAPGEVEAEVPDEEHVQPTEELVQPTHEVLMTDANGGLAYVNTKYHCCALRGASVGRNTVTVFVKVAGRCGVATGEITLAFSHSDNQMFNSD